MVGVIVRTKKLTFMCDLDLRLTSTNVLNSTSARDGELFCQVILKSIYNCRSYGPDGRTHTRTYTEL